LQLLSQHCMPGYDANQPVSGWAILTAEAVSPRNKDLSDLTH
jgi:hypothetical protein